MSLKISYKGEIFDLPNDFNIEIENTSPIFNERGSQSISATLPITRNNLRLTGHINRLDTHNDPNNDKTVTVSDGAIRRTGKINFSQLSRSEGITFNIGFDEGEIYNLWNDVSLQSLPGLPVYTPENGTSDLITYLGKIMLEKEVDPALHIFPICVNMPSLQENDKDKYYPEYLNPIKRRTVVPSGNTTYTLDVNARKENLVIGGKVVETTLPEAYGLTPFLKVSWIMEFIFSAYGYRIIDNPISTHPQLKRLVVLNNAADCCVKGRINYADLMPDCTINEFFQALYCRFGLVYFIDGNTRSVRFKFLKDIISSPASQDWSKMKADFPIINYTAGQQLKLSASTSISGPYPSLVAAPATDSLDKFLEPYGHIVGKTYAGGYLSWSAGYFFIRKVSTQELDAISSDFFPWDKGDNLDYFEVTSIDECLPMKWTYPDDKKSCPAYLFGKIHRYTNISSSDIDIDKEERHTPLCFCFSHPQSIIGYPYGSPRCTDPGGSSITENGHTYDISMTFVGDDGLFNRFWKGYDAILRHANHSVEIPVHLSSNILQNTDFSKPVSLEGQRLLIDQHRYQLPLCGNSPATVVLRTLKLLHPFDLEKEQTVVVLPQLYKWIFINNQETIFNSVSGEQVRQWRINLSSNATWLGTLRRNEVNEQVSDDELPYLVPTQEDYDSQHSYWIRKAKYSCDLYYKYRIIDRYTSQGYPIYKEIEAGGVHYDIEYDIYVQATTV